MSGEPSNPFANYISQNEGIMQSIEDNIAGTSPFRDDNSQALYTSSESLYSGEGGYSVDPEAEETHRQANWSQLGESYVDTLDGDIVDTSNRLPEVAPHAAMLELSAAVLAEVESPEMGLAYNVQAKLAAEITRGVYTDTGAYGRTQGWTNQANISVANNVANILSNNGHADTYLCWLARQAEQAHRPQTRPALRTMGGRNNDDRFSDVSRGQTSRALESSRRRARQDSENSLGSTGHRDQRRRFR